MKRKEKDMELVIIIIAIIAIVIIAFCTMTDKKRYIDELLAQGILSFINSKNKGIFEEVLY